MTKLKGPKFIQYFQPVIDGLRDLGSSAKPSEVYTWIAEHYPIPKGEIESTTKGGQSKFQNKVGWARFYLAKGGLIATEQRGVWVLTEKGRKANFSHEEAYNFFNQFMMAFSSTAAKLMKRSQKRQSMKPTLVPQTKKPI